MKSLLPVPVLLVGLWAIWSLPLFPEFFLAETAMVLMYVTGLVVGSRR